MRKRFVVLADVPANGVSIESYHRTARSAARSVERLRMIAGGFIRYGYAPIEEARERLPELFAQPGGTE